MITNGERIKAKKAAGKYRCHAKQQEYAIGNAVTQQLRDGADDQKGGETGEKQRQRGDHDHLDHIGNHPSEPFFQISE